MKRVVRIGGAAALAAALFVAGGIGLFRSAADDGAQARRPRAPPHRRTRCSRRRSAARSIRPSRTSSHGCGCCPTDWQAFASLGLAYVQQARVTADPSYYPKAQGVLRRSLGLERDDNFAAMVGMAALAAARHDFAGALRWGEQAKAINPYNGNVYGVIGDAQVELGRYRRRVRDVPDHGGHPARRRVVRPRLVRPRADGRRARRDPGDGGRARHRRHAGGRRVGQLSAGGAVLQPGRPRRRRARVRARRGHGRGLRPAVRRPREGGVGARAPPGGDRRIHGRRRALPGTRVRDRARRPVRRGRTTRAGRPAVRAGPRGGAALPCQRRQHRPGAGAVRRGARRSCRARSPPLATSGRSGTACTWPTPTRGRCTRTGATRRPPSTLARRWRSATATRCSRSTPG